MLYQIAPGKVGHRGVAVEPGGERQGHRVLARPDARDDERRPLTGLVGIEHAVAADRDPLRQPVARPLPDLGDVELAARRIDPDPEAGEGPIPEHRVALDLESRHDAVGEGLLVNCHGCSPHAASARPRRTWAAMLLPVRATAAFSASRIRWAYLAVVPTVTWPSRLPITGRPSPRASAREA